MLAVGYLGFAKSHLISITIIFSVLDGNLPIVKHNLAFYLFAGFTVVSTLLWGRLYCGRICAFGALTQFIDAVLPERWRITVPIPPSSGGRRGSSSGSWPRQLATSWQPRTC